MHLQKTVKNNLNLLSNLIGSLSNQNYTFQCEALSNATIGEHTRHIIEMFQILISQYDDGTINYDNRKRDINIQTDAKYACEVIDFVIQNMDKPNKSLTLSQKIDGEIIAIQSNYERELLYNLEHSIHHQAMIKVALIAMNIELKDEKFGIASSTIEYREQCAR